MAKEKEGQKWKDCSHAKNLSAYLTSYFKWDVIWIVFLKYRSPCIHFPPGKTFNYNQGYSKITIIALGSLF